MAVINSGMRKVIKGMVVTCQTAQFISLMPKPKDFVTRIVGDVVYLSAQVQKLSEDMNGLLDMYADIPMNYMMTQVNSIAGSLSGITNRLNIYAQNAVVQTFDVGSNTLDTISEITGGLIDNVGAASNAVSSLAGVVAQSSSAVLGDTGTAESIKDATDVILEWSDGKFDVISGNLTDPLARASQSVYDTKMKLMGSVDSGMDKVSDSIENSRKWVENLISELKSGVEKLSEYVDTGFKDVTGLNSISKGASFVESSIGESGNGSPGGQAVSAVSSSISSVLNNFSISKVILAFSGVLSQSLIVKTGLDQLPPIDFESMLNRVRSEMEMSNDDLYKELMSKEKEVSDLNEELAKLDMRNYDAEKYDEFVSQFDEKMRQQRTMIRTMMKSGKYLSRDQRTKVDLNERQEIMSAIKEVGKFRKQAKKAKTTVRMSDLVGDEIMNFRKETEYVCNSIKSDWDDMMNQYRNAIKEIKSFFETGGDGDRFIDDCCDAINDDCDAIKDLCKNIGTQLIGCTMKVSLPADLGACFPNPVYKLASFWMDLKTIIKFIKDLITYVLDILNNINKLARIMLNGINSFNEIVQQLMELFGLKWFMDLIQDIIDMFGERVSNAKDLLENSLSPVYFKDTQAYDEIQEVIESITDGGKSVSLSESFVNSLGSLGAGSILSDINDLNSYASRYAYNASKISDVIDDLDEKIDKMADNIVAYKSPILMTSSDVSKVSEFVSGEGALDFDLKFVGWHFYHTGLGDNYYAGSGLINKIFKKIKSKIIKKAVKTGSKTNGGVNGLRNRWKVGTNWTKSNISSFRAFFWYSYYTDDLEQDCFIWDAAQDSYYVSGIVRTSNGSIVEISDGTTTRKAFVANNNVKSGDYVSVDGIRYRVN